MNFDPTYIPYPSKRYPVYASRGMVCASSPQASAAGLEALRMGGNAVDAAVATAAALTVCEPTANGIGADAFALIWCEKDKKLYGLNASGRAPRNISIEKVKARIEGDKMPVTIIIPFLPIKCKGFLQVKSLFLQKSLLLITLCVCSAAGVPARSASAIFRSAGFGPA